MSKIKLSKQTSILILCNPQSNENYEEAEKAFDEAYYLNEEDGGSAWYGKCL